MDLKGQKILVKDSSWQYYQQKLMLAKKIGSLSNKPQNQIEVNKLKLSLKPKNNALFSLKSSLDSQTTP